MAADSAALERLLGDVSLVIHRADLLALLRSALPDTSVITSAICTEVQEQDGTVHARFADGRRAEAPLLIGADGLHSVVRSALFGAAPPRYAGYTAWRGVIEFDPRKLRPGVAIGRGKQFGQAPMAHGKVYWFATQNCNAGRPKPPAGHRAALLELFGDWHAPIRDLIAATDEAEILHNDIFDREPLARWSKGRITLLGDAAHPMTPNLGQGANQALEDAVVLADALATAGPGAIEDALRAYEAARRPTANAVVLASRRVGQTMQLASPVACWLRDALLGTAAARRMQLAQLQRMAGARS